MPAYLKQGVGDNLVLELPFAAGALTSFTVDVFQHGERIFGFDNDECGKYQNTIVVAITPDNTLLLSPQRASLCLRGVYGDGSTVIIEDIPVVMSRSPYRKAVDTA